MKKQFFAVKMCIALVGVCLFLVGAAFFLAFGMLEPDEFGYISHAYEAATVLATIACEVAIIALWRIVALIQKDMFYGITTLWWFDLMLWSIAFAGTVPTLTLWHMLFFTPAQHPGVTILSIAVPAFTLGLCLLLRIARGLYLNSRAEHEELCQVI